MSTETSAGEAKLPRVLGPTEALCVVVGSVIGSGIFIVPAGVAKSVPFIGGIAFVWIIGGLFSMAGALTLAELSTMLPSAGGPYVYLREAYGRLPAFLFGWTFLLISGTGSNAAAAVLFAGYLAPLTGLSFDPRVVAIATLAILAGINALGVRHGGNWQNLMGLLKIGAIAGVIIAALVAPSHAIAHAAVLEALEKEGAIFVESLDQVPEGQRVIFSAHGVAPSEWDRAKDRSLRSSAGVRTNATFRRMAGGMILAAARQST